MSRPRSALAALALLALAVSLTGCKQLAVFVPHDSPIALDHHASLEEAVTAAEDAGYDVIGYEYSNDFAYGGITMGDDTVDEALADFEARFGTEPVVVKVVVSGHIPIFGGGPIVTGRDDDFTAPPATG